MSGQVDERTGTWSRVGRWPAWPGLLLCGALGVAVLIAMRLLPPRPYCPDVLIALAVGALVVNTPLRRLLSDGGAADLRDRSRYAPGLKFVGRTVLRFAVVLMGLKIQARFFGMSEVLVMFCAIAAAMPVTFFFVHAMAVPLRVPRTLADLIAAGTMICGASAVNAMAPVVGAKKEEQGIALGTVFLFSVIALLLFRPIAVLLEIPVLDAGLWSGLAVNDLSSAVAVGAQMGPGGAEMAAASKSARVVLLAPLLVLFSVMRCHTTGARERGSELRRHALANLPGFVAGFVALAVLRAAGDHLFAGVSPWTRAIDLDRLLVDLSMMTVAVGIGFHLSVRGLLAAGSRALLLGCVGASSMAALSLGLVVVGKRSSLQGELLLGAVAVAAAYAAFRASALARRAPVDAPLPTSLGPAPAETPAAAEAGAAAR
jgi:uncharacterized integral membrane protein (TIGR00698 family)